MKKTVAFLVSFLFIHTLMGQLSGQVIDEETNNPISFANLLLTDLEIGVAANANGEFVFKNEIPNHNTIKVSALGYSASIFEINEETNRTSLIIKLSPKHFHLHEVVISSGTGVLQDYSITPIASKPMRELNILNNSNLGEAISNLEGVYNASTGKGIFKPVIRGLSGIRVLTFINGVKLENQQWGGDHGLGVSSIGIGQVEVIKGPASLLYGADALGGVLYLKDETFAKSNSIEASVSSNFESNTNSISNGVAFKMSKNNFRFNVFANHQDFADYQTPDKNFVKSSRFRGLGSKIVLGYNRKKWVTKLGYNFSNNLVGIPGHTHDTLVTTSTFLRPNQVREEGRPSQKIQNHLLSFDNQFFFHESTLKITLGQSSNRLEEYEKFTIPLLGVDLNTSSYYIRYKYKFKNQLNLIGGLQGMLQQNRNRANAEEQLIPNFNQLDNGIFGVLAGKFKKINYQFGVRYDNRQIDLQDGTNQDFSFSSVNYSAGASYDSKKISFSINVSSGVRNPHVSELFSEGGHSAAQRYEIGDAALKPETGNQLDVSVKYKNEHLDILLNPFVTVLNNYVFLEPQDSIINGFQVYNYRQSNSAMLVGGEAVFHYHPHFLHDFHLETSLSFVYGNNETEKTPLSFIPQPRVSTQVIYNFDNPKNRKFSLKNVTFQHQYFADQNRVVENEISSRNYNLFHLGLNSKIKIKEYKGELGFGVQNIFNSEYIDHLSALKIYQIPNPGRNYYVTLKFNINKKIKIT